VTRLLDRLASRSMMNLQPLNAIEQMFMQSYAEGGVERILPEFQSYSDVAYKGNSIVFTVILKRLTLFSEATFKFQDLTTKRLFGTPDLSLLEQPWPGGTTGELLARMEQDVSLSGNAFICNLGDRLERWRPDRVGILVGERMDGSYEVIGYEYDRDGCGLGRLDPDDIYPVEQVAHWSPIPDPTALFRGMSWLDSVVREINGDIAMSTHKQSFLENGATPNLMLKYARKLNQEQVDKVGARFQGRYGGPTSGFKTVILDEGADLQVVGNSFEQMAFTSVQAAGENRIAAAGGVPAIVAGLKEGLDAATYSNYGQAMRAMADLWARPQWRSAASALAKLVKVPPGSRLWYDVADIAALREGEKDRADTAHTLATAMGELIRVGYTPDSVTAAVNSGDMSLLIHTGAIPTALYPDGKAPVKGGTP